MSVAVILAAVILSLAPRVSALPLVASLLTVQGAQTPQTPDSSATPSKPCPTCAPSSTSSPDCKPAVPGKTKCKKHRPAPPAGNSSDGPAKTVVRNGSTTDPTVAISPGLSEQQISQQMKKTDQLLAAADANLKVISGRQLSASQQDTVTQIKSFIEQAKTASSSGDVQRAYNLANKANLLSVDLKGH